MLLLSLSLKCQLFTSVLKINLEWDIVLFHLHCCLNILGEKKSEGLSVILTTSWANYSSLVVTNDQWWYAEKSVQILTKTAFLFISDKKHN